MEPRRDQLRPRPQQGWLAAVLPVGARRFRSSDPEVAAVVAAAGGELVDEAPDVEIGPADELVGDAEIAVVPIAAGVRSRRSPRVVRGLGRLRASRVVKRRAAAARQAAGHRGYGEAAVVTWEPHARLLPGLTTPPDARSFQRFPRSVVVVCGRGTREPTAFEAAVEAAQQQVGRRLELGSILLGSSGVLVADDPEVVLRVSIGPAGDRVDEQRAALDALRSASPSAFVADRIPWVLATGRVGLAVWSVERRLHGVSAPPTMSPALTEACLRFACELYATNRNGPAAASPRADAEVAASYYPDHADAFRELGRHVERALPDTVHGFGHGDFWSGNLLVAGGELTGVVDWPSAGPARLPLVDVMHLRANVVRDRTHSHMAAVVVEHLIPEARAGGHELDRAYCRRLGLRFGRRDLEALVAAYWLEELRRDLVDPDRDPENPGRPEWRTAQLAVLEALGRPHGIHIDA